MRYGRAEMTALVTKSRNRKLVRVTSLNKRKYVDLSDCNRYLSQYIKHQTTNMLECAKLT